MQLGIRYETVDTGTSHRLAPVGEKGILNKITTRKDSCGSGEKESKENYRKHQ